MATGNPFINFSAATLAGLLLVISLPGRTTGQERWVQNFQETMQINGITAIESSPAHLYLLSGEEGLAVFRAYTDSLRWLYTSSGMQNRGSILESDIRFAYIYGNGNRLSVVEPTSVLGVYSATVLPDEPLDIERIGNYLYIAMGNSGIGRLSLQTPEAIDTPPTFPFRSVIAGAGVIDLASDNNERLYVLLDDERLEVFERAQTGDGLAHRESVALDEAIVKLFLTGGNLIGSTTDGELFQITEGGVSGQLADVNEAINRVGMWQGRPVVRTEAGRLWVGTGWDQLTLWKENVDAGNLFTVVNDQLWVQDYNQVYPVMMVASETVQTTSNTTDFQVRPVANMVIPFPRPLLVPLEVEGLSPSEQVEFIYRSDVQNAEIRGRSLHWQPTATQIGRHEFQLIASSSTGRSDSTQFTVEVRPFNAPPRFTPAQRLTIPVGEEFTLQINAVDPDGMNQELIRYLGVDLPQSAVLEESTGMLTWTPTIRQVGEFEFQVIATDQYGAAAQQTVTIRVIETNPEAEAVID